MPRMEAPDQKTEILKWCQKRRPDLIQHVEQIFASSNEKGMVFLLVIGFAAGREFQRHNPENLVAL